MSGATMSPAGGSWLTTVQLRSQSGNRPWPVASSSARLSEPGRLHRVLGELVVEPDDVRDPIVARSIASSTFIVETFGALRRPSSGSPSAGSDSALSVSLSVSIADPSVTVC